MSAHHIVLLMENDSFATAANSSSSEPYWTEKSWIATVSFNGVLILVNLWVLFSLIQYGRKTKKWNKVHKRNSDKLNAGWVYSSTVSCAVMSLIRLVTSQVTFHIGFSSRICEIINDVLFVEYALVLFTTYIFLWLRQRIFYTNNMLNINFSKVLRFFSVASLVIIILAGLATIVVNTLPTSYPSVERGCIYKVDDSAYDMTTWIACALVLVIGQVMLVALLLYPLQQNTYVCSCFRPQCCYNSDQQLQDDASSANSASFTKDGPCVQVVCNSRWERLQNKRSTDFGNSPIRKFPISKRSSTSVKRIMRRTIVFGAVSLTADLVMILVLSTSVLDPTFPEIRRLSVLLYDSNVFLNLMLVVFSFTTYKDILTSLWKRGRYSTRRASNKSSTSNS